MSRRKPARVVTISKSIRMPQELCTFVEGKAAERGWTFTMLVLEICRQYRAFEEKVPKVKK